MSTVYRFKPWARLKGDPQKVGEEIERVRESSGGSLAPKNVVDAARPKESLLHDYFDWSNKSAGEKYREYQAAHLIRSIVVVQADGVEVSAPVRAFVSIQESRLDNDGPDADEAGSYTSISEAVRIVSYREQMMRDALRDLDAYRLKYQLLSDVSKWRLSLETARRWLQKALDASQAEDKEAA